AFTQRLANATRSAMAAAEPNGLLPLTGIDWRTAVQLCRQLGLRLLSEAEWEFSCRATTTTPTCFGSDPHSGLINFDGGWPVSGDATSPFRNRPVAVGSLPANAFGLHEMHGNVGEW